MEKGKIVIKHHGLVILRDNQVKLVSETPYLSVADGGLEGIIDNDQVTYVYNDSVKSIEKDQEHSEEKSNWKKIENAFANMDLNYERIIKLIRKLRQANNKKDLVKIYEEVLQGFYMETRKLVEAAYNEHPDLILSMMAKGIVTGYVKSQIKRTNPSKIIVLQTRKSKGEDLRKLMEDSLELDFSEESTNGVDKVLAKSYSDSLDEAYQRLGSECFNCANGYVANCEKMADYPRKKDIAEYPFITDGFQVYVNDELDKFIVTRCSNFKKASQKVYLTPQQMENVQAAKTLIELLYYDVDTIAESREIEARNKSLGYR